MYGSESWTLTTKDEDFLRIWERKILRKIYGPKHEEGRWAIRTNDELYQLYQQPNVVNEVKARRIRWLGHVERMPEDRAAKKVWRGRQEGQRKRGRPRKRWMDDVEEDLKKLGYRSWKRKARDRGEWAKISEEAKALQGL